MAWTFLAARQNVTPASNPAWQSVDISAFVPAGCTMALFHILGGVPAGYGAMGLRKPGSTDNFIQGTRSGDTGSGVHWWGWCGVSGQAFEAYLPDNTKYTFWLIGYATTDVNTFTNGVQAILDGDNNPATWTDLDLSATLTAGAVGALWEIEQNGTIAGGYYGVRRNGSTGSKVGRVEFHGHAICGVDAGRLVECNCKAQADYPRHAVVGEIMSGVTFLAASVNKTPAVDGAYHDVDCFVEAPGAIGLIFDIADGAGDFLYAVREKGSAEDDYLIAVRHVFCVVKCNASQVVEAKFQAGVVATAMQLVGYLNPASTVIPARGGMAGKLLAARVI